MIRALFEPSTNAGPTLGVPHREQFQMISVELCVARFDEDTKVSFLDLYSKIDAGVDPLAENKEEEEVKKEIVDDENDY